MAHRLIQQAMGFASGFGTRIMSTAGGAAARGAWGRGVGRMGLMRQILNQSRDMNEMTQMGKAFTGAATPRLGRNMAIGAGVGAVGNMGLGAINDRRAGRRTGFGRTLMRGIGGGMAGSFGVNAISSGRVMLGRNPARFNAGLSAIEDLL